MLRRHDREVNRAEIEAVPGRVCQRFLGGSGHQEPSGQKKVRGRREDTFSALQGVALNKKGGMHASRRLCVYEEDKSNVMDEFRCWCR